MGEALLSYGLNVLIAVDQLINAFLAGSPDETLSSRLGKSIATGGWASMIPWPHWWVAHCIASIEADEGL